MAMTTQMFEPFSSEFLAVAWTTYLAWSLQKRTPKSRSGQDSEHSDVPAQQVKHQNPRTRKTSTLDLLHEKCGRTSIVKKNALLFFTREYWICPYMQRSNITSAARKSKYCIKSAFPTARTKRSFSAARDENTELFFLICSYCNWKKRTSSRVPQQLETRTQSLFVLRARPG